MEVSVIVPAYNCGSVVPVLLEALRCQDTVYSYEVIVVDNGSSDNTMEILKKFSNVFVVPFFILEQPRGVTISAVRNFGVKHASGSILAFIDSDCLPEKNWIQKGCNLLNSYNQPVLIAGGYQPPNHGTWVEHAWHSTRAGHKEESVFVHGGNFFINRSLFIEVGGFDESIETSEDYDLGRRVAIQHKVVSEPGFTVIHFGEANSIYKKIVKERWYSRNMLQTLKTNVFYKPFWISLVLLINLFLLVLSVLLAKIKFALVFVMCIVILSSLLSLFFCIRANNYSYFIPLVPISFAYMFGRCLGIVDSIVSACSKSKNKG